MIEKMKSVSKILGSIDNENMIDVRMDYLGVEKKLRVHVSIDFFGDKNFTLIERESIQYPYELRHEVDGVVFFALADKDEINGTSSNH